MFTCKDCPDREVGCHSVCEKYKREKAEHERIKAAQEKERDIIGYKANLFDKLQAQAHRKAKRTKFRR